MGKQLIRSVLISLLLLTACSPQENSPTAERAGELAASSSRAPATTTQLATDDESAACRYGAESMITVAQQAVNDPSSRPQRREARRLLMEDWVARLAAGEDPCAVYADIGREATTF